MENYRRIFEQIVKMSTDGFIVVDSEGKLIHINKQYADFLVFQFRMPSVSL